MGASHALMKPFAMWILEEKREIFGSSYHTLDEAHMS